MSRSSPYRSAFVAAVLTTCAAAGAPARAGAPTVPNFWEANTGAGTCQGALPAFAGSLRARPMGIRNEGGDAAFVTCALDTGNAVNAKQVRRVSISLDNTSTGFRVLSCTLVDGLYGFANYLPKSIMVAPGVRHTFSWTPAELPGAPYAMVMPNVSCQLPAGVEITFVGHNYEWN